MSFLPLWDRSDGSVRIFHRTSDGDPSNDFDSFFGDAVLSIVSHLDPKDELLYVYAVKKGWNASSPFVSRQFSRAAKTVSVVASSTAACELKSR